MSRVIHMQVTGAKTLCGLSTSKALQTVPARLAKYVTCAKCLASLNKVGR